MPRVVKSYLSGDWVMGEGARVLHHAGTGAAVAEIGGGGLDIASALDWGRRVGGANLRALTLHERALILKEIGQRLLWMKDAFHAESHWTGATRKDGWPDIEGGIGTLLTYASRARRDLPNAKVLTEGPLEPLSKDDSFSAQHILTPRRGIAIHINAYNFPVWGLLEKIAPTLLAGMPALVKPARETAYLTEQVVARILETGLLPEGALQMVAGRPDGLLDHLDEQDVVTFTGSAETGAALRAHPSVVSKSVRFTMEADSLNAAILGPDAGPGTPEFEMFVTEVLHEMTAKAGQKCTAIRRILVPRAHEAALAEALVAKLRALRVGLPEDAASEMGPLVSQAARRRFEAAVAEIAGQAEMLFGGDGDLRLASGDVEAGAFVAPVLMRAGPGADAVHEIEAFGPAATLVPYDDLEEAAALAARGKGSLVASVFTNAPEIAAEMTLALAPFHGRVLIGNRASARTSTGHGAPLAPLIHGGPGRAGGGEEMGGMRGIAQFMQRTAVQGTPALLSAVTDVWSPGAATREDIHPFRKSLSELRIGDRIVTGTRKITEADVTHFAQFTGDTFYAHMDREAARANPFFEDRVAHGYLILSFAAGLFVDPDPGPVLANYGVDDVRFLTPVYFGDTLGVTLTVKAINPRAGAAHGEVRWDCVVRNQHGVAVARYDVLTMVAKDWPPS